MLSEDTRKLVKKSTPDKVDSAYVAFRKALRD